MTITPVDSNNNLFYVEDIYPQQLLARLTVEYALAAPWRREDMQADWLRRRLDNTELLAEFDQHNKSCAEYIGQAIQFPVLTCDTGFWLDEPGFTVDQHLDNSGVAASMQIYMWDNEDLPGTAFYANSSLRREFKYKKNTGYIMINGPDQLHGMIATVPSGNYRLCSYTWFYPKV